MPCNNWADKVEECIFFYIIPVIVDPLMIMWPWVFMSLWRGWWIRVEEGMMIWKEKECLEGLIPWLFMPAHTTCSRFLPQKFYSIKHKHIMDEEHVDRRAGIETQCKRETGRMETIHSVVRYFFFNQHKFNCVASQGRTNWRRNGIKLKNNIAMACGSHINHAILL